MGDLISRSALGVGRRSPNAFTNPERAHGWNDLLDIINAAPAIDPESLRPHGRWIRVDSLWNGHVQKCSHCMETVKSLSGQLRFCPNCGARMQGGSDE